MLFEFSKNMQVDKLDGVPEKYHGLYEDNPDGGFRLKESAKGLAADYDGTTVALNEANSKTKSANDESAGRRVALKAFDDIKTAYGLEGDDVAEAITGHITDLTGKVKGGEANKVNLDKVNGEWQKRLDESVEAGNAKESKMRGALDRYLVSQAATSALAKANGSVDLLLPHLIKDAKVAQDGEDFVARVVDAQGEIRLNGSGGFMNFDERVAEMKTDASYAAAFKSEADKGGTGTPPGGSQHKPAAKPGEKSANDKISEGLAAKTSSALS